MAGWLETIGGISATEIKKIRADILAALGRWKHFARQSGVPASQTKAIGDELDAIQERRIGF